MGKKLLFLALVTLALCVVALGLRLHMEQQMLAAEMVRLHVVANSDETADQAVKLQVRDAVLPVIRSLTAEAKTARQARTALTRGLPKLETAARAALPPELADCPVQVSLGRERFPRRIYDTFELPAGTYEALRITLGAGEGHNWWCVAFPALCLPATVEDFTDAALAAGLQENQVELMTAREPSVRVKLRLLDWVETLFD